MPTDHWGARDEAESNLALRMGAPQNDVAQALTGVGWALLDLADAIREQGHLGGDIVAASERIAEALQGSDMSGR